MALVCELKRDGSTLIDFQGGTTGAQLDDGGWLPRVARIVNGRGQNVFETLKLIVEGTSHDNLSTYLQALAEAQRWADAYIHDRTVEEPVWFHAKLNNETGERRALVYSIEWAFDESWYGAQAIGNKTVITVTIERGPYWEATTATSLPTSELSWGELYDYLATALGGDVSARVSKIRFDPASGDDEVDRIWIGVHSDDRSLGGDASLFETLWECEDGTNIAGDASDDGSSDTAGASPGGGSGAYVEVSETAQDWDDTWHNVLELELQDVTSDYSDQYALNLWLLRAEVTSGTWEVQFRYGYSSMDDDQFVEGKVVEVEATSWDLYEMDVQQLPLRNLQGATLDVLGAAWDYSYTIQIWARRTDGSGNLHLDCVLPVPFGEGFVKGWDAAATSSALLLGGHSPRGDWYFYTYGLNSWANVVPFSEHRFGLPPGDGRLIVVTARSGASDITDTVEIDTAKSACYERWLSLRGSE